MDVFSLLLLLASTPLLCYILVHYILPRPQDGEPPVGLWFLVRYIWLRWALFWSRRKSLHLNQRVMSYDRMVAKAREMSRLEFGTAGTRQTQGYTSLYINGSDTTGDHRIVVRVVLRPDGRREACFLLRVHGVGDLVLPKHPACLFDRVPAEGFVGEGLKCSVLEPLRTWRISYNGLCRVGIARVAGGHDDRPLVHVRCTFLWSAFTSYFDFSTDVHPRLAAENLAKVPESGMMESMYRDNQHHYHNEQFGMIHGVIQVSGQDEKTVVMRGVKSHSSGTQQEKAERHIVNHMVLEDGTCLHVGGYCQEDSSVFSGYMTKPNGAIFPAVSVDLSVRRLFDKANNQLPKTFSFSVRFESRRIKASGSVSFSHLVNVNLKSCLFTLRRNALGTSMPFVGKCILIQKTVEQMKSSRRQQLTRLLMDLVYMVSSIAHRHHVVKGFTFTQMSSMSKFIYK
ncbi:uncharacterized protein LOC110975709 [Acanthaster planci]|uniref:Uncharacterized protein LOC110975709 n=1 Tax=Acanthaster planci TaxID=133434 RepID=A0A8B7XV39_ACAPL|nr:uncharacterized protein LOC110975709 [Acanthaster planci]